MKKRKIKIRIPVAPPSQRHRSVRDYDRKKVKKVVRWIMNEYKEILDKLS